MNSWKSKSLIMINKNLWPQNFLIYEKQIKMWFFMSMIFILIQIKIDIEINNDE